MSHLLFIFDGIAVGIFGCILSASFCDCLNTKRNRLLLCCYMSVIMLLQGLVCIVWDFNYLRLIYPLIVHLPLMLSLYIITKKFFWSLVSVFLAYLCCQLRRWVALLAVYIVSGDALMLSAIQLIITLPLLLFLLHYVTPSVRKLKQHPAKYQVQFAIIPTLYYVFDYFAVIYTNFLVSGNPVVVEFIPFVFCLTYLLFLVYFHNQQQKEVQLQQLHQVLSVQVNQSAREINALKESQALTRQYRHDLRHHLQYISECIENGRNEQAQQYITAICHEISAQKVQRYCENDSVNLILSAFVGRAQKVSVKLKIQGQLPQKIRISDNDLCVLLSNALENALHASEAFSAKGIESIIDVRFFERDDKLFLQITNPCNKEIKFENGIPVSSEPNHGIGVQSICAVVQSYNGLYTFMVQDEQFILRISL